MTTSNGIHNCSILLFVIAERVESAKKYRNAFEVIRQRVIDQISDGGPKRQNRQTVPGLTMDLAPTAESFQVDQQFDVDNGSFEQFSQIITDMTGETFVSGVGRFDVDSGCQMNEQERLRMEPTYDDATFSQTFQMLSDHQLNETDYLPL